MINRCIKPNTEHFKVKIKFDLGVEVADCADRDER